MFFTEKFDKYVCSSDAIDCTVDGFELTARVELDYDLHIDDDDCYNVDQSVTGCNDEQQKQLMEARRAWKKGDWFYCGIVMSVAFNGVTLDHYAASTWGIEANYPNGDNDYLNEIAEELAVKTLQSAKDQLIECFKKAKELNLV